MDGSETAAAFQGSFGHTPDVVIRAPGRVNLIGDHTDYNGGLVLPMAINRAVMVAARATTTGFVEAHSEHFGSRARIALPEATADPDHAWTRYPAGVIALLRRHQVELRGAELWIGGDLPSGAGLASSAALEVGVARACLALSGKKLSRTALATLCRQAEQQYAGSPCGIMDQLCCTSAKAGHALLIDCSTMMSEHVPLPRREYTFVVIDSGIRHSIAGPEYRVRRRECAAALATITETDPIISSLRKINEERLDELSNRLEETLFRRVRHVVTETARVARAADLLRAGDLRSLGHLMISSHESLRDDFEVSCPELDEIVSRAVAVEGVYGARMTGGGFGGCAIAIMRPAAMQHLKEAIETTRTSDGGTGVRVFAVESADAADEITDGNPDRDSEKKECFDHR